MNNAKSQTGSRSHKGIQGIVWNVVDFCYSKWFRDGVINPKTNGTVHPIPKLWAMRAPL